LCGLVFRETSVLYSKGAWNLELYNLDSSECPYLMSKVGIIERVTGANLCVTILRSR